MRSSGLVLMGIELIHELVLKDWIVRGCSSFSANLILFFPFFFLVLSLSDSRFALYAAPFTNLTTKLYLTSANVGLF